MAHESATPQSHDDHDRPLRVLFVKDAFAWPRASGHDIHTYYLLRAMAAQGHSTALAVFERPHPSAVEGVESDRLFVFGEPQVPIPQTGAFPMALTRLQEKFRGYWGVEEDRCRWVAAAAAHHRADAVVVVGLGVLPYLGACTNQVRVWYAADEWVWHHLSLFRPSDSTTWSELKPALVKGVYERAYRGLVDRTWVVSEADRTAFRRIAGYAGVDLIHYGADTDYYRPGTEPQTPNSCTFWGRLDFQPNIQAIEQFCRHVWPAVRAKVPDATFAIYGFKPTPAVTAFHGASGITVTPDAPDIRPAVRRHQVVVLPFVSGGGIKNKLLEASAMGKAVVGTARIRNGLNGQLPFVEVASTAQWLEALTSLWRDDAKRVALGTAAREWVVEHHTWAAAARQAAEAIRKAVAKESARPQR